MRLRKKPWARAALLDCNFFVSRPEDYAGKWREAFPIKNKLHMELGCGKGGFISKLASSQPDINYIAIDIKDAVLILAKEKIELEYTSIDTNTNNIRLMAYEIMLINKILTNRDSIDRIYINFCNPWYKNYNRSRRLTHPNQLNQYREFLIPNGEIWFKSDDVLLFKDSLGYFKQSGFSIEYMTEDLHNSDFENNIETEHEKMFSEQGQKIKFLIARKN
jgi:tRNA (guanine-N7-)-methyltransferase